MLITRWRPVRDLSPARHLDHVIALHEEHLRRILREYVNYHHEDRLHDALEKDTQNRRIVEPRAGTKATVIAMPHLGGLHHRYTWRHVGLRRTSFLMRIVHDGVDLFSDEGLEALLQLNHLVVLGRATTPELSADTFPRRGRSSSPTSITTWR